jgi:acetylornithine deacetylase/succinyl-diaminopimelate desuccinylase family protein
MGAGGVTELARLISDLVRINSVNPSLDPTGPGEGEIAAFVADWMRSAGLEVALQETAAGRPNVIGIRRGTGGGRSLILNAHMDTVSFGGMTDPLSGSVDGNRLFGRGSYDMKASLAAAMLAVADLGDEQLRGDVIVTAVTDEEYASIGTQAIVREYSADACIITEPSHLEMCIAHKGFVWAEIETHGTAAHGSLPDVGVDAIALMGPILTGIGELDRKLRAGSEHPLLKTGSLHASLIEGGTELSTYPDRCRVQIERRTVPGETDAIVEHQLRELIGDGADLTMGISRQPFEIAPEAELVQAMQAVIARRLGQPAEIVGWGGWMDSALTSAAGIPSVVFGPTGHGAHADDEWVDLDSVQTCHEIYADLARTWCG